MATHEIINSITLGSNASSVTFSAIPQTYTDLLVKIGARITNANGGMFAKFNGSSTGYSSKSIYGQDGNGGGGSGPASSIFLWTTGTWATAGFFGNNEIYIPNYTSTTNKKTFNTENFAGNQTGSSPYAVGIFSGRWNDVSAITTIVFTPEGAGVPEFLANSTFYLYGIKNS